MTYELETGSKIFLIRPSQLENDILRFITGDTNYAHDPEKMANLRYVFKPTGSEQVEGNERVEEGHKYPLILGTMFEAYCLHAARSMIPASKRDFRLSGFSTEFYEFLYPGEEVLVCPQLEDSEGFADKLFLNVSVKRSGKDLATMRLSFSGQFGFQDMRVNGFDPAKCTGSYEITKRGAAVYALATGLNRFGLNGYDIPGLVVASRSGAIVQGVMDQERYHELDALKDERLFPIFRKHSVILGRDIHDIEDCDLVRPNLEARAEGGAKRPTVHTEVIGYNEGGVPIYISSSVIETMSRRFAIKALKDLPKE